MLKTLEVKARVDSVVDDMCFVGMLDVLIAYVLLLLLLLLLILLFICGGIVLFWSVFDGLLLFVLALSGFHFEPFPNSYP